MIVTEVSGEIETTFLSETPDQIPAKEDEKTISGDYKVLATPKEMNLTAIDLDEKNGVTEDAVADNNGNDSNDTSPLVEEEVQIISEKLEQIEKEEIFEEPEITNKREKIEEDVRNTEEKTDAENIEAERLEVPAAESESFAHNVEEIHEMDTSPDVGNTKTSEVEKAIREEPGVINQVNEPEEPSTLEEPGKKIGDDTEKSEHVSSLVSQVLTEETCDEKMENTKNYVEKADIEVKQTNDPLVETSILKSQLPEHEIENEDLERAKILDAEPESDVQNVQDVYETTTSPSVEESGAIEIEKIIREVSERLSEESGGSETKIQIEDTKGLESSDANSNSEDQNIEEIHESKASTCESKNEEVSENNETESSESDSKPDFPAIEEIKEIDQDPIAEQLPAEEEKEEFNPVSEIADTYEGEFKEEEIFELVPEPKVHSVEIESKPLAEEAQGGKEDEETHDVPETVSEPKAQNVEEVNYKSIDEVKEETLSEFIPEPKVQSAEKNDEIESEQPVEETQAGEEIEETKNVHVTVSENKARDVEEVNRTSIDMGSCKADEFSKLNPEASEAFSEPTKHVVDAVKNDVFVTPTVVNELTISKEFQLNDDSKNVFDSVSSIESIETAEKAGTSKQHEKIEKIFLEDASTAVSDNVHDDEESEKESAQVDEEVVEANTTVTLSEDKDQVVEDSRGTHLGSALDESNINEIAKVKEAPEKLPEAINEEEDKITDKTETGFTNPDEYGVREETFSELPEPKVQSFEEINELESKLSVEESQEGKESEEIKDGPETVSELKAQNVEEVNETSRDLGSSKADQVEKLKRETPEVFSDPINQVAETESNDDFVSPIVATELTSSNEFQLNGEPANVTDSVSSAHNIETTEKADSSQQDQGIEKIVLEDDSTAVSDNVHEDEERESDTAKVDDEIKEARATITISEHKDKVVEDARETDPSSSLKESNTNEIAKVKEILEELPKAINEDAEAGSKAFADQEIMKSDAKDVQEAKGSEALIQPQAISVEKMDEFDPTPVVGKTPINEEKEEIEAVPQSVPEINFQGVNFNHPLPIERREQMMEPSSTLAKDQHHETTTDVDMVKSESANKNDPRLNEADSLETGTTRNVVTRELENSNSDLIVEDTGDKATEKEIDEERMEVTTKCDEGNDIAATTGTDVTLMRESELINEPMKAFSTISKTTTPETIELIRTSEVDAIQLEETSIVESQLQEHDNETDVYASSTTEKTDTENAEVEKSEVPAAEYESYESETPLNGDTADSLEICTTENVAPRELESSNSDLIVEDTENKATEKKIDEENIAATTKCDEGTDIAATTATEATHLGESELINQPINAFVTSSETTCSETIETVDTPEVDEIKLEETSTVESQLLADENETEACVVFVTEKTDAENIEAERLEVPAAESESFAHNVVDIHETDTSPDVGDTKTSEVEKAIRGDPGVIDQVYEGGSSDELSHCREIQAENKEEQVQASSFVFLSDEESHESRATTLENMEDGNMKKDDTEEDNLKPQEDYGVDSLIQNIETVEELDKDVVKAEESTGIALNESRDHLEEIHKTKASPNVDISGPEGRKEEIKSVAETSTTLDVEAVIDDETNEQPLAIEELEEHQEPSFVFLSGKKDESEESKISGTKTEANVLGVEEVHETETTAAVEKTNADKVEEETKEALETIPEPKCQDVGVITDRGILFDQNLPLEAIESAKDGVTETGIAPRPASNVTSIEDIELIDEAAKVIDTGSETKKPETFETVDTESEVIGIEGENEYVVVGETDTIQSEKVLPEVPKRLPEGKNQGPEAVTNDEIDPTSTSQDENIKEDVSDSSFVFLSSEENHITTTINTEDDSSKLQETTGMLSQHQNKETIMSDADEVIAEDAKNSENIGHSPGEAIVSKLIPELGALNVEESQTETSPNREEDETKTVPETTFGPDHEDAADIIARYIIINQTFPDANKEEIIKGGEETDINPIDEVVNASDSSDTKTPETIQTADITELDSEIIKSPLQKHETEKIAQQSIAENVEEIHDTSTRQTLGESDAKGSVNVFDVEETKNCSSISEPKDQAIEDVRDKGTSSTVRETGIKERDQEARESLETMTKEIYQDIGPVSKEEIASIRPTEGEKIEEKGIDSVPESKDTNLIDIVQNEGKEQLNEPSSALLEDRDQETVAEDGMNKNNASSNENIFDLSKEGTTVEKSSSNPVDEKCKEDFDLEFEKSRKALQPESEILGSEVDHTPKETDIMNKQLEEPVTNMREIESETQIENTTEAAQAIHESTSKELLTEEPEKAEENNTLKEPITADNIDADYEKIENDGKNVENESENLSTETTMPIKEGKSLEVTMGKPEDKLGAYSEKDETAITNVNNFESQENDTKESEDVNASEFPSSKTTSDGEFEDKGENMVDEKQRNFIRDPVSIIPRTEEQVEKLGMLPTAKDQEAIRDVTEPKELIKEPEEEDKISLSQSQEQIARKEYLNEKKEDKNAIASRNFQVKREDSTSAKQSEDFEEGKHGEEIPETIEKMAQKDPAEVTEEPKTEAEDRVLVEEEKTDEEEENEHKKADSGSDAPVMVEASKDIDVKTPNKKSHSILSGVGSKVKHSIAKVKKAITGKSSNQKSSSPKADKKTESIPLL